MDAASGGTLALDSSLRTDARELVLRTPTRAVAAGVGYIPRERRTEGLVMDISVAANITLAKRCAHDQRRRRRAPRRNGFAVIVELARRDAWRIRRRLSGHGRDRLALNGA